MDNRWEDTQELERAVAYDYAQKKEERKQRARLRRQFGLIGLCCALLGGGVGGAVSTLVLEDKISQTPSQTVSIATKDGVGVVEAVAEKALPSVVGIVMTTTRQSFFGVQALQGSGSGFIVNKDGYIVTNSHVVDGGNAQSVTVSFYDGTEAQGRVLWADPSLDLAVVKVDNVKNLVPAELGDSSELKIGEEAIAIGNPLGLDFQRSVTSGVISGLNRTLGQVSKEGSPSANTLEGLIQTDASINQGNSGGPLLNREGKVIGINSAKISSAEGLGFSIPINTVKPIVDQIAKTGTYSTVQLGIQGLDTSEVLQALHVNLGTKTGVFVTNVPENTDAARAGIAAGDVVTAIDDHAVSGVNNLKSILLGYQIGDQVTVTIVRAGKEQKLTLTFTEQQAQMHRRAEATPEEKEHQEGTVFTKIS